MLFQWQKSTDFYKEQLNAKTIMFNELVEKYNQEKQAIEKLLLHSRQQRLKIEELEAKDNNTEKNDKEIQTDDVVIKTEVVEIV